MKNLQELISSLNVSEEMQLKFKTAVGDESDPQKIMDIIQRVLDGEEKILEDQEKAIDAEARKEMDEAEAEFNETIDALELEVRQVKSETNKKLEEIRIEELKDDLNN